MIDYESIRPDPAHQPMPALLADPELRAPDQGDAVAPEVAEAPAPRNWDQLTSRGFLGLKWLFNIGGARDKRKREKLERRAAISEAWEQRDNPDFAPQSGIRESRYGQRKWREFERLQGLLSRGVGGLFGRGAASRAQSDPASDDTREPLPANAEASAETIDAAWRAWAGIDQLRSQPAHRERQPLRSAMKAGVSVPPERTAGRRHRYANALEREYDNQLDAEVKAYDELRANPERAGDLQHVDASMEGSHQGKAVVTGVRPAVAPIRSLLGPVPVVDQAAVADRAKAEVMTADYRKAMQRSREYEKVRQQLAGAEVRQDQRSLAFPDSLYPERVLNDGESMEEGKRRFEGYSKDRLEFFNAFWRADAADAARKPEGEGGRRVRFEAGNSDFEQSMNRPAARLDPDGEGEGQRVLPTGVHRYLVEPSDASEPTHSDADALTTSLRHTAYNRQMFTAAPQNRKALSAHSRALEDVLGMPNGTADEWALAYARQADMGKKAKQPRALDEASESWNKGLAEQRKRSGQPALIAPNQPQAGLIEEEE